LKTHRPSLRHLLTSNKTHDCWRISESFLLNMAAESSRAHARQLAVLIAVATIDLLGAAMVFPLLPFYALKLKVSPTLVGAVLSSFFVAQLLAAPIWGRISDRYGRRPALLAGLGALIAGYVVFAFADSLAMLFLARII